jgi:cysteine-rich repeat protein
LVLSAGGEYRRLLGVDADYVYAVYTTVVRRFPKTGGRSYPVVTVAYHDNDSDYPIAYALSDDVLYWTSGGDLWYAPLRPGSLGVRIAMEGGYDEEEPPGRIVADESAIYWEAGTAVGGLGILRTTCCGDGRVAGIEHCDDGNLQDGDGCSARCRLEVSDGSPPPAICGDSILAPGEDCDDGNIYEHDGCTSRCELSPGYVCEEPGTLCHLE